MRTSLIAAAALLLAGCQSSREEVRPVVAVLDEEEPEWRRVATPADQARLESLDRVWAEALAEARQAAVLADEVMMVVRWRKTPARAVRYALNQLFRVNADVAGIILSRADLQALARSGTGDQAFYRAYEKYYAPA